MKAGIRTSEFVGPAGLIMYLIAMGSVDSAVRVAIVWAPAYAIARAAVKIAELICRGRDGKARCCGTVEE